MLNMKKKPSDLQNEDSSVNENLIHNYLRSQFPWFSEREIKKVIDLVGPDLDKVSNSLHDKSGTRRALDDVNY
jgi:hypothetical protein